MTENDPDDLSGLPSDPLPNQLAEVYRLSREKLARANRARAALKVHDDYRASLITELQTSLQELEEDCPDFGEDKAKLHALNGRLIKIIGNVENKLNDAADIVEARGDGGPSSWFDRFASLLKIVLRIREVKADARRLLVGDYAAPSPLPPDPNPDEAVMLSPAVPPPPSDLPILPKATTSGPETAIAGIDTSSYGPLVLRSLDYAFGLLLLALDHQPIPPRLILQKDNSWLPGHPLLIPQDPEDPDFAPIEAGFLALDPEQLLIAELKPWLDRGVMPFVLDPQLQLPRLVYKSTAGSVSHVLVREEKANAFQEQVGGTSFDLDGEDWLGFQLNSDEAKYFWRCLDLLPGQQRNQAPRLSTRGGVTLVDRQGFLATGLGLPFLTVPATIKVKQVQLKLADYFCLNYTKLPDDANTSDRQIWQPSPMDRRLNNLAEGVASFTAFLNDDTTLQRTIQLTALPERVRFKRVHALAYREDWGLPMGPLAMPETLCESPSPAAESLQWARKRLNQGDSNVNALFEQQMLESLAALFQRRPSIQRRDFLRLYAQLRNKSDEWPDFPEAVLRGWCEGGWLEEGVEQRTGRWRLQPIDPRLVHLPAGGLQLVGLLSARGLVALVAIAHELGLTVRSVPPACADMPRGWRFFGEVHKLAPACGLPFVEVEEWVPDPGTHPWILESALPSDSPPWPVGLRTHRGLEAICGRRRQYHYKTIKPLPERQRASIHLKIANETSTYGKRRWHSYDPDCDKMFTSCHRNRVVLHALVIATNGLWPFGFTDSDIGQIDRLYDAEAYLPLPLARWAALTGRNMPGPTRHKPGDHTYRYLVASALRSYQLRSSFLPLTPLS